MLAAVAVAVALPAAGGGRPSPDVPLLLVSSDRSGQRELYAVSLDGRGWRRVSAGYGASHADVSPDGRLVVYEDDRGSFLADAHGVERAHVPGKSGVYAGVWSPDGTSFAYTD